MMMMMPLGRVCCCCCEDMKSKLIHGMVLNRWSVSALSQRVVFRPYYYDQILLEFPCQSVSIPFKVVRAGHSSF